MAKKVQYYDPNGKKVDGWYSEGHVYTDEALNTPIPFGSRYQSGSGDVWQMGRYGGTKVYSPNQLNADGTWNPAGNVNYQNMMNAQQQLETREPFKFDLNGSALYQSLKNSAVYNGQRAMQDTMGQAAGLTGGYGSSYAQAAGQQAYNNYLMSLNDQVPAIYAQERAAYDAEGDRLMQQLQLANQMYGQDRAAFESDRAYNYGVDRDAVADEWRDREWEHSLAREGVEDARWDTQWAHSLDREGIEDARWKMQWDASQAQQSLENTWAESDRAWKLVDWALSYGVDPSDEDLEKAGITREQFASAKAYLAAQMAARGGGGGGGRYYSTDTSDTGRSSDAIQRVSPGTKPSERVANDIAYRYFQSGGDINSIAGILDEMENNGYDVSDIVKRLRESGSGGGGGKTGARITANTK